MPGDSAELRDVPAILTAETYAEVRRNILGDARLPEGGWRQVAGSCVMHRSNPNSDLTPGHSTSLRQQLHPTATWPGSLHEQLENRPPELYLVLSPAAVAIRHVLDGFYAGLNGGIMRRSPKRPPVALLPIEFLQRHPAAISTEIERSRSLLSSYGHVCLIDHNAPMFDSSRLQLAADILHEAGVTDVSALRTRLYGDLDPREINLKKMEVPKHASFLHKVGKLCCDLDYAA